MSNNRNGSGCLASLLGLFTVLALALALFLYLVLSRPSVRSFVSSLGIPMDQLLPDAFKDMVLSGEAEDVKLEDIHEDGLAFRSLSDDRKVLYQQILNGINARKESFDVHGATKEDIEPTYHAILADHPELFWVDGSTNYIYFEGGDTITLTPGLSIPLDEVDAVREKIDAEANAFLSSLPSDASEYDVAKAAYEYVINTTDYDINASNNQNIQSVFVEHASVCAGYSRAYQYLLQRAGMVCAFVEGSIPSTGEEHAWNIVHLGDGYTYVDVTWGDPTYPGLESETPEISYDYLGLTTSEIERDDHAFADASMWPACTSPAYSYYANKGLLFDGYDTSALSAAFWQQVDEGASTIVFKFSNEEAYRQACDALEAGDLLADDMRSLFLSTNRADYSFQYQVSDSLYILKLFL